MHHVEQRMAIRSFVRSCRGVASPRPFCVVVCLCSSLSSPRHTRQTVHVHHIVPPRLHGQFVYGNPAGCERRRGLSAIVVVFLRRRRHHLIYSAGPIRRHYDDYNYKTPESGESIARLDRLDQVVQCIPVVDGDDGVERRASSCLCRHYRFGRRAPRHEIGLTQSYTLVVCWLITWLRGCWFRCGRCVWRRCWS